MPTIWNYSGKDAIPGEIRSQIGDAVDSEWPRSEASVPLVDPRLHPTYFVLLSGQTLLSYGRTIWAYGSCRGHRLKVYGFGDVVTPAFVRRRGHASAIVAAATAHIREDAAADAAILHTQLNLDRLYGRCGWTHVGSLQVVTDEPRSATASHVMALVLSGRAQEMLDAPGCVLTLPGDEW